MVRVARQIADSGVRAVAISAVFSPLNPSGEEAAAEILREHAPGLDITLSHKLGRLGQLERENVAILNSSLMALARHTTRAFATALSESGIDAPLYLTQNDGTVMHQDYAATFPVYSFSSGPTNSMRGGRLPVAHQRRHRRRCRRHDHRRRLPAQRLPQRSQQHRAHRRRADELPHARRAVDRLGRRQHRRPGDRNGRAAQRRLPDRHEGADLRRRRADRERHRRGRRPGRDGRQVARVRPRSGLRAQGGRNHACDGSRRRRSHEARRPGPRP